MILQPDTTVIDPVELEARTGWAIKPEGACLGDVCVPLTSMDVQHVATRLGMPTVADSISGLRALGPHTAGSGRALTSANAPDLVLPDVDGAPCRIADLRPQKVVLVAWASW